MDNINQLLSLNIEIEGLLRVLAERPHELAQQLLLKKCDDFVALVRETAHTDSWQAVLQSEVPPTPESEPSLPFGMYPTPDPEPSLPFGMSPTPFTEPPALFDAPASAVNESADIFTESTERQEFTFQLESNSNAILPEIDEPDEGMPALISFYQEESSSPEPQKEDDTAAPEVVRIDEMLSRREASDLSRAFTLNDRFRFQRTLFNGSREAFNDYISRLSSLNTYDEAVAALSRITKFDEEDPDVNDFLTILQNHYNA